MARVIKTITENYTVLDADDGGIIIGNSSSPIAVTMPSAIGRTTFSLTIMNANGGTVTVLGQSISQNEEISIANSNNAWTYALGGGGGGGGSTTLSGLTDVSIPSPSTGEVLTYNGSLWISANMFVGNVTYYIDSSDGDDENDGLTEITAFRSFARLNEELENFRICNNLLVSLKGSFLGGNGIESRRAQYKIIYITSTSISSPAQINQLYFSLLPTTIYIDNVGITELVVDSNGLNVHIYESTVTTASVDGFILITFSDCAIENSSGTAINIQRGTCSIDSSIVSGLTDSMNVSTGGTIINAGNNIITGTVSTATGGAYRT